MPWIVFGLAASCTLVACKPKLRSTGTLTIDARPFAPSECHVLVGATGIELFDAAGARLELTLPPARLDAWQEISGAPRARYTATPGTAAVDLGACGFLSMSGEGYHGAGRRAASGKMSLACSGASSLSGRLSFSGCF